MDDKSAEPDKTAEEPARVTEATETKPKWSKPVLVPLSIALTEFSPTVGSDGGFFDSSHV